MIHRVVLEVEIVQSENFAQPLRMDQWRHSGMKTDGRRSINREQVVIAPKGFGTAFDRFPTEPFPDGFIVIVDFERTKAEFADVNGNGRIEPPTLTAFQTVYFCPVLGTLAVS